MFDEFAVKYPEVTFLKVDVDEVRVTASKMEVTAMPTFDFFFHSKRFHRSVGAAMGLVEHFVQTFGSSSSIPSEAQIREAEAAAPSSQIPMGAIWNYYKKQPLEFAKEIIVNLPVLIMLYVVMEFVFQIKLSPHFKLLGAYVALKIVRFTPLKMLRLPLFK